MIRSLLAFLLLAALPARAAIDVSATVPSLAAIARAIGGDDAKVRSLSLHTQDPHFVDARPSLALDLSRTDLLIVVGLELEIGWLPNLITGARNPKIQRGGAGYLDVSRSVTLLDLATAPIDRSQGDIHPGGNPHYLYDPRAAAKVAQAIAERMASLDPQHADGFRQRAAEFLEQLEAKRRHWEKRLEKLEGVPVITYHRSFTYLADWLGFKPVAMLEPKPGIPPNPAHIASVLSKGRKQRVGLVIQEEFYPNVTSQLVAEKIPAALVELPSGANFKDGQSYLDYVDTVGERLERAMKQRAGAEKKP